MEYIANKTGIAGLVKKIAGVVGVVVVAGGVAGCVTTGANGQPDVYVPDRTPWHKAEEEKLGGCVNLDVPRWRRDTTTITKRAVKKNETCVRKMTGSVPDSYNITQEPSHGKLILTTNNNTTPLEIKYTPNQNYTGIDEYTIEIKTTGSLGGKTTSYQKTILYIGDFNYGEKIKF